jgi:hypothetical protein
MKTVLLVLAVLLPAPCHVRTTVITGATLTIPASALMLAAEVLSLAVLAVLLISYARRNGGFRALVAAGSAR